MLKTIFLKNEIRKLTEEIVDLNLLNSATFGIDMIMIRRLQGLAITVKVVKDYKYTLHRFQHQHLKRF